MNKLPIIIRRKALLILHGWGSSAVAWDKPKELLQKAGYSVFIPDLPGFGSEPPPKNPWSVDDYVDFVLRFAQKMIPEGADTVPPLRCEPKQKFILIGHSFGGRIAIKLAAQYPEKVEKLILTGAAGPRFATLGEKIKVQAFSFMAKMGGLAFYIFPFTVFKPLARKILCLWNGSRDYYYAEKKGLQETFKKVIYEDLTPFLSKIKTPTLLLWGEKDKMIPLSYAKLMLREIPKAKLEIIQDAEHIFPYKGGEEIFVENVIKFILSE